MKPCSFAAAVLCGALLGWAAHSAYLESSPVAGVPSVDRLRRDTAFLVDQVKLHEARLDRLQESVNYLDRGDAWYLTETNRVKEQVQLLNGRIARVEREMR